MKKFRGGSGAMWQKKGVEKEKETKTARTTVGWNI